MAADKNVLKYFSGGAAKALSGINGEIDEIRLRTGRPLCVTMADRYSFVTASGSLTADETKAMCVSSEDIRHTFEAVCRYSVHSCQGMICRGFITVAGGHRAGICGTAVYNGNKIENIKYINGLNFRIAREIIGAADKLAPLVTENGPSGILIFGEPCSGKTTVLRDLCRRAGDRFPVSLIDERGEIAAAAGGENKNRIGANTDVFSGFSKYDGIITAVRAMSPRMIICDEIGSEEDISALEQAHISGVKIAAAMHGGSVRDIVSGKAFRLIKRGAIQYAALIKDRQIKNIYTADELIKRGDRL